MHGYLNNLEYFKEYMEGELLLGTAGETKITYTPHANITLEAGVYLRKRAGDDAFISHIAPILSIAYTQGGYTATAGSFSSDHGIHEALYTPEQRYKEEYDEGLKLSWNIPEAFSGSIWAVIKREHSPKYLENLHVGTRLQAFLQNTTLEGALLWNHYGGQQYSPEGQYMRDNITGNISAEQRVPLSGTFPHTLLIETTFLGSLATPNRRRIDPEYGMGGILRCTGLFPANIHASYQFYRGENYQTWTGFPLYETDSPYHVLEIGRHRLLGEHISVSWGARFDILDIDSGIADYFDDTEHLVWFDISTTLVRPLKGLAP